MNAKVVAIEKFMKAGMAAQQSCDRIIQEPGMVKFTVPGLGPSVNHYVRHVIVRGQQRHIKTPEALAWERDVAVFARGQYITGKKFGIRLIYRMGKGDGFDVDNLNKSTIDAVASAGCIRDEKGNRLTDRWFKRMEVDILDSQEDRAKGPETAITIWAM